MAFCMYCGKKLEDGEVHVCPMAPEEEKMTQEQTELAAAVEPMLQAEETAAQQDFEMQSMEQSQPMPETEIPVMEPFAAKEEIPVMEPFTAEAEPPVMEPFTAEEETPVMEPFAAKEETPVMEPFTVEEETLVMEPFMPQNETPVESSFVPKQAEIPTMEQPMNMAGVPPMDQPVNGMGANPMGQSVNMAGVSPMGQSVNMAGVSPMGQSVNGAGANPMGQPMNMAGAAPMGQSMNGAEANLMGQPMNMAGAAPMGQSMNGAGMNPMGWQMNGTGVPPMGQSMQQNGMPNMGYSNQANGTNNQQFDRAKQVSTAYFKQLADTWLGILKRPFSEGEKFAKSQNMSVAIGLLVIQALLTGLFGLVLGSKYNSILQLGRYYGGGAANLPLIFICCLFGSLVFSAAMAGLLFVGSLIVKSKTNFMGMLCVVGARAVVIHLVQILAIVVALISVPWGIAVFSFSFVAGMFVVTPVVYEQMEVQSEAKPYVMMAVTLICFIVLYVLVFKIGMNMFIRDIVPSALNGIFDTFSGNGLTY